MFNKFTRKNKNTKKVNNKIRTDGKNYFEKKYGKILQKLRDVQKLWNIFRFLINELKLLKLFNYDMNK